MSKAIRSYPQHMQQEVIRRRLAGSSRGAGYWAAEDAINGKKRSATAKEVKEYQTETAAT